jgi:hypothetical protein
VDLNLQMSIYVQRAEPLPVRVQGDKRNIRCLSTEEAARCCVK